MTFKFSKLVSSFALASALLLSSAALANNYDIACIGNATNVTVGGTYKIGFGPWKSFTIAPKSLKMFSAYNQGPGYAMYVQYDRDPGPGHINTKVQVYTKKHVISVCNKGATAEYFYTNQGEIGFRNF